MLRTSLIALLLSTLVVGSTLGEELPAADRIAWEKDLATGMVKARETGKILMICINAKHVDGREDEEPAAKGLREVVYLDRRIVKRSRDFVCVLMTPKSSVADHGRLGSLGVEAPLISPQHLFVNPEGDKLLYRREYWRFGKGEKAVEALLGMMEKAEQKLKDGETGPAPAVAGATEGAPAEGDERAAWIAKMLEQLEGTPAERDQALRLLIENDQDGDCTGPLIELLPRKKKEVELLRALIRALGRNELEDAAEPISKFLTHRDPSIRANAAVSLEYIGCRDRKVVSNLMKAAGKQKDELIANHMFRALGRCGVNDSKVRGLLIKMLGSARSEFASYGPAIGLAYFKGDPKAARGVESVLKMIGVPGGRRGGGQNIVKRAVVSWTLANIGDPKSADFVREELLEKMENMAAFWVQPLKRFYESVVDACEGSEDAIGKVEYGVKGAVGFSRAEDKKSLMDDARKDRDGNGFTPLGDDLLGIHNED